MEMGKEEQPSLGQVGKEKRKRTVIKLKHELPYSAIGSFEKYLEAIKAYCILSPNGDKALKYTDFEGYVKFPVNSMSSISKFLSSISLLEDVEGERGYFRPKKELLEFQKLIEWNKADDARHLLANVIKDTWFADEVRKVIRMRESATEDELVQRLGIESGADPVLHKNSLIVILQLLTYVDIIQRREDGTYGLGSAPAIETTQIPPVQEPPAPVERKMLPTVAAGVGPEQKAEAPFQGDLKISPGLSLRVVLEIDNSTSPEKVREIMRAAVEAMRDAR